jgi:FixJ family two-component response regulator
MLIGCRGDEEMAMAQVATQRARVSIVDDDESVRESLPDLLTQLGFVALAFGSAQEFLDSGQIDQTQCLVLDVAMPGMTGPELHAELLRRGYRIPTIFITAHSMGMLCASPLSSCTAPCLTKPFSAAALLAAVNAVLAAGP